MIWHRHIPLWASCAAVVAIEGFFLFQGYDLLFEQPQSHQNAEAYTSKVRMFHIGVMVTSVIIALIASFLICKVAQARKAISDIKDELHSTALARNDAQTLHKRLSDAERIANLGSWHWNIETGELAWSDQVYRIFGLTAQAISPSYSAFLDAIHSDDRPLVEEAISRALSGETKYDIDHRILRGDGRVRIVHEQGEIIRDRAGRPIQMSGIVQDVTDIRKAEQEHIKSETRLRGILSIAPEAIIAVNASGIIQMFNTGAEKIFGYAAETAIGQPLDILLPEKFRGRHLDMMRGFGQGAEQSRLMSTRKPIFGRRSDGSEFPAEASIAKLQTEDELLFTVILRDITDRMEQQLKITAAKESAEAANLAKSQFLANMSHELRTPLNAIIGFSQVLRMHTFGPLGHARYDEYSQNIEESGSHLLKIINDILDIAKIESGRIELSESYVDLESLARRCLDLLKVTAEKKSLSVSFSVCDEMPHVFADERKVQQIIINLVGNAIKFTPQGGNVEVSLMQSAQGEPLLTVSDSGNGIATEKLSRLGQPFVQLDAGLNRQHEGSGLGLALCKELIKSHNGTIEFVSEPGCGMSVTVRFPAARARYARYAENAMRLTR